MQIQDLQADVLVVGGGLIGLSSALSLARAGASVICVDADSFGTHQSAQNWGFIRQQGRGLAELDLMVRANAMWPQLSDDLGFETSWTQGGNLAVYDSAADEQRYQEWVRHGVEHGIETGFVTQDEVRNLIPAWKRRIRGGIFAPDDGHADPQTVIEAYVSATRKNRVKLLPNTPVQALRRRGSKIIGAETASGTISAETTVLAAGSWSRRLLGTVGINLPQSYVVGTVALTSPVPHITDTTIWGPGFSFRQRRDGRFVCAQGGGGVVRLTADAVSQAPIFLSAFRKNWKRFSIRLSSRLVTDVGNMMSGRRVRDSGPPSARVRKSEPRRALRNLKQTLSGVEEATIDDSWAGVIDSTPDGIPVIDGSPGPDGLVIATGFSGHGYGLVPAVGAVVSELVQTSTTSSDLTSFTLARFKAGKFRAPNAVL